MLHNEDTHVQLLLCPQTVEFRLCDSQPPIRTAISNERIITASGECSEVSSEHGMGTGTLELWCCS